MKPRQLILRNLQYFWKKHLLLLGGIAISGAVITGALMVGDSVKYSLEKIVQQRLGRVSHVLRAGDRYFTLDLAEAMSGDLDMELSSLLLREGSAVAGGGAYRLNRVLVLGVDAPFDRLAGTGDFYGDLQGDSVIVSQNLAQRLNLEVGDEFQLRLEKASLIPSNAPFVSDADQLLSFRASVKAIASQEQMGRFNLQVSQTAPYNVFISREHLARLMDFEDRANVLLFAGTGTKGAGEILEALQRHFSLADAGLVLEPLPGQDGFRLASQRVFIEPVVEEALDRLPKREALSAERPGSEEILTYFVNRFQTSSDSTPYSFVSTLPDSWLLPGEIMVNPWLAEDLGVQAGDSLTLSYFKVGPLRQLSEEEASFRVKAIVPLEGRFADATLMPDLPGLSDAGNCRDWDTGVPISLESIRDKDEEYWDTYGGTPKAFIALGRAQELWSNRFGALTAHDFAEADRAALEEEILGELDPMALGYSLESALAKGQAAAREGVDFSQLFLGLSFFLLLAGIMLIVLLFRLNLESRLDERKTLRSLGLPEAKIRQILLLESLGVALLASLAGLLLALLYNKGVFVALNGVWKDVVRTPMMFTRARPLTLLTGGMLTLAVAFLAFWFPLRKRGRSSSKLRRDATTYEAPRGRMRLWGTVALSSLVLSLVLVAGSLAGGGSMQVGLFFGAGGLLLLGALSGTAWFLERRSRSGDSFGLEDLAWKNAVRNRTRSMSIVILFAIGAFLVISTGSNRKDLHRGAASRDSGSGGFLYYAESTLPVLQHLDDDEVRYQYSLSGGYSIVQLRRAEGDDASCLNLNKVVSPRILGVDPSHLEGRFSFVTRSPYLDEARPWASLEQELEGGLVPAIADETVIKWGLGMSVGDTLHYVNAEGQALDLLLIGGLAPSVFQGSVLIAEEAFITHYPASSGTQVFLVDAPLSDTALIGSELSRGLRDLGWEMELSADRLARFYSVTNAYLSIFMVMGGLGLLLGTFGLVVVLWRSMLERREELAMFRAMGYPRARIRRLLTREYLYLLYLGIAFGFLSAILATLPSVLSPHTQTSLPGILIWLGVLLLNGLIWIRALTAVGLRSGNIIESLRNE